MTKTIEQLSARVAELEAEIKRLAKLAYVGEHQFDDYTWKHSHGELLGQLLLAQAEIKRLRIALAYYATGEWEQKIFQYFSMTPLDLSEFKYESADRGIAVEALAQPSDTSALDTYVAEKVKDMQADRDDCLTLAKSNFAKLMALTQQRDLAVEAMQMAVEMIATNAHERRHVRWKLQDALSTIKESEGK